MPSWWARCFRPEPVGPAAAAISLPSRTCPVVLNGNMFAVEVFPGIGVSSAVRVFSVFLLAAGGSGNFYRVRGESMSQNHVKHFADGFLFFRWKLADSFELAFNL